MLLLLNCLCTLFCILVLTALSYMLSTMFIKLSISYSSQSTLCDLLLHIPLLLLLLLMALCWFYFEHYFGLQWFLNLVLPVHVPYFTLSILLLPYYICAGYSVSISIIFDDCKLALFLIVLLLSLPPISLVILLVILLLLMLGLAFMLWWCYWLLLSYLRICGAGDHYRDIFRKEGLLSDPSQALYSYLLNADCYCPISASCECLLSNGMPD